MRFNSCELKQLATDPSVECTKEGVLCLREKEGKLWNKTDAGSAVSTNGNSTNSNAGWFSGLMEFLKTILWTDRTGANQLNPSSASMFLLLTERWCRLIGNLLFYLKGKQKISEPIGVLVLEQFTVKSEEQSSFVIEFDGDDRSTYFLASNPIEAAEWINALRCASYAYLKKRYLQLKQEEEALHAESKDH